MLENNYSINTIQTYIKKCNDKVAFHTENSKNSRMWNNFLSTVNIFLTSSMALCITLLTAFERPVLDMTITSAVYVFLIAISSKIKEDYSFITLNILHGQLADDFDAIVVELEKLKNKEDDSQLDLLIQRYYLCSTKHIQSVKCMWLYCWVG